ncbi:MAG TPA: Holliday junction branch migration protein RuvA [Anaerovoracaceae bacterium]|nr:Holliday junction branch migration protein RuvA [Anaerovoracaceae bacterium]
MIRHIRGEYLCYDKGAIVIQTQAGIGFRVFVPDNSPLLLNKEGDIVTTFTHMQVKEDSFSLFGFPDEDSLRLFEKIISVNGVGPKAGLSILSLADINTIKLFIVSGDAKSISKANGIGKKTSERIILELSDKIDVTTDGNCYNNLGMQSRLVKEKREAIIALTNLGYSKNEATNFIERIEDNELKVEEYVKIALRNLM